MNRALKIFAIFLLAAMLMGLLAASARADDTEPIIIYADQQTPRLGPLLKLLGLDGVDNVMAQWGEKQLLSNTPKENLAVYASMRKDGALVVLVINEDSEKAFSSEIRIKGFLESGPAVPYHLEAGALVKQKSNVPLSGNTFDYEFGPNSITLFIIPGIKYLILPLVAVTVMVASMAVGSLAFRHKNLY